MYYEAILLAAGQGKRMQASRNKILLHLLGKPVITYALDVFLKDPACGHIILVVQEDEQEMMLKVLKKYFKRYWKQITMVTGGNERQDSVYQGLLAMEDAKGFVMIHDGARPFVTQKQLKMLYRTVTETQAAILGVPVKDTIKKIENGGVVETIPRDYLWQIQTPQAFVGKELKEAHEQAMKDHFLGTDDASLIEKYSAKKIHVVLGSYENIKLTTPDDMIMGEAIIKRKLKTS